MNGQILLGISLALAIIHVTKTANDDTNLMDDFKAVVSVSKSLNHFSTKFYEVLSRDDSKSFIFSPLSANMVLRMAGYGARGKTSDEMSSVLEFHRNDNIQKRGVQILLSSLNDIEKADLTLANKIFLAKGLNVKSEFSNVTETIFKAAAETVDFVDSSAASNTINEWCEKQTHSHIKDIVKPEDFDTATALVLVNAVYFKGNWLHKFNENETQWRNFYVDSQTTKKVPMMHRLGSYRYGLIPEVDARFIELPYETSDDSDPLKMVIVLPNNIDGLSKIELGLQKMNLYQSLFGDYYEVDLFMPKFKIQSSIDLKSPLQEIGLKEMFQDTADFTGITDSSQLKVGKIIQKAFIEVNEEGSEAAAATGLQLTTFSIQIPFELRIDHPFYYSIVKQDGLNNGVVLFHGRCTDIESSV